MQTFKSGAVRGGLLATSIPDGCTGLLSAAEHLSQRRQRWRRLKRPVEQQWRVALAPRVPPDQPRVAVVEVPREHRGARRYGEAWSMSVPEIKNEIAALQGILGVAFQQAGPQFNPAADQGNERSSYSAFSRGCMIAEGEWCRSRGRSSARASSM